MYKSQTPVSIGDRIISVISYVTAGWVGLIYMVILYFVRKPASLFLRYNIFQSIFISFFYFLLCMIFGFISNILLQIPLINALVSWFILLFNRPIIFEYSAIQSFVMGLFIYMSVVALLGKMPRVYWVSKIIDKSVR